jgi:hypothetical protein
MSRKQADDPATAVGLKASSKEARKVSPETTVGSASVSVVASSSRPS